MTRARLRSVIWASVGPYALIDATPLKGAIWFRGCLLFCVGMNRNCVQQSRLQMRCRSLGKGSRCIGK